MSSFNASASNADEAISQIVRVFFPKLFGEIRQGLLFRFSLTCLSCVWRRALRSPGLYFRMARRMQLKRG
jgi:hypothetical protein